MQAPSSRRILGIDPGLQRMGWGIIAVAGNRLSHVANGTLCTHAGDSTAERLKSLAEGVEGVLAAWDPDEAVVEETFVNKNPASTLKLGLARAVALLVPARAGLAVAEYPTNLIKKAVVGAGHADKAQVGHMVRVLLPGVALDGPDAADALAAAICHAHHSQSLNRIREFAT